MYEPVCSLLKKKSENSVQFIKMLKRKKMLDIQKNENFESKKKKHKIDLSFKLKMSPIGIIASEHLLTHLQTFVHTHMNNI